MNSARRKAVVVALLAGLLATGTRTAHAGDEETGSNAAADAQILREIREHSEVMDNLESLSDHIGPRLTGSPLLKQANDWTAEMFKKYGLANVCRVVLNSNEFLFVD